MFVKQLACLLVLATFTAAKVPSYIKVCGRRNPNLDQCVLNSVASLDEKLRAGIPDLDIPSVEPLKVSEITFADMPNFKCSAVDVSVTGLSAYEVKNLHVDLEKQQVDLDVTFKDTRIDGQYKVSARILVPVEGNGPLHLTSNNVNAKVRMNYKLLDRGGKKYMYFSSMTLRLKIKDYTAEYDTQSLENTPLREAVNQALGNNHQEILDATTPTLEKAISEFCLQTANKICKHFTYEELFPDRE